VEEVPLKIYPLHCDRCLKSGGEKKREKEAKASICIKKLTVLKLIKHEISTAGRNDCIKTVSKYMYRLQKLLQLTLAYAT